MTKKIIASALLILMLSVVFIACGKKDTEDVNSGSTGAGETTIEYTTNKDGETFVTNANGEMIPVTTSKDGAVEFYSDLITKTAEQVSKEAEEIKNDSNTTVNDSTEGNKENTTKNENVESTVQIGKGDPLDENHAAVIENWN